MDFATIIQKITIMLPTFFMALVFHEYAHAWMAKRFGDKTALWEGRLTFNPIVHADPFGSVILPILAIASGSPIFFGWAKPVPIDPRMFSDYRRGLFWVAFAGPLANIILGVIASFLFVLFHKLVPVSFAYFDACNQMLRMFVLINFFLAVFNMIPIPPLDGSKMLMSKLSTENAQSLERIEPYGFFIIIALMMSGILQILISPAFWMANLSNYLASFTLGLFF